MRQKPRGAKFRNLTARAGSIYYERVIEGRRIRLSAKTDDWDEAAAFRDLYEERKRIGQGVPFLEAPRFEEFAARYLREGMAHLAATTREDRLGLLKPDGRLLAYFGSYPLDEIRRSTVLEWWTAEVEGRGRSPKTGKNYLDALSAVLGLAVDLELLEVNPVELFRGTLRRRNRTQRGRVESDPGANVHPIEKPETLQAFLEVSREAGGDGHLCDFLQLDAGLRLGEAAGLRWCDVWWGRDANDTTRALSVEATRARGRYDGPTKSGRSRRVALSRRLRAVLQERWLAVGRPEGAVRVIPALEPANYRNRHFRRVCAKAGLGHRRPKDLRDTFASQLLTAGVQLGYVSQQLGHADVAVTARHYARWAGGDSYRRPLEPAEGEIPADFLARLVSMGGEKATGSPQSPPSRI